MSVIAERSSQLSAPLEERQRLPFAAWLIDLDGTLYHQFPVRLAMAAELLVCGVWHFPLIRRFRREQERIRQEREFAGGCPYSCQLERTATGLGWDVGRVSAVVTSWMESRPGKWLKLFQRRRLVAEIREFRASGGKTALVSDYPARRKLQALGLESLFDTIVACGEPGGPRQLKPSPEGFMLACNRLGVEPGRCLVIGDRDDADGEAARIAGMAFCNIHNASSRAAYIQAPRS